MPGGAVRVDGEELRSLSRRALSQRVLDVVRALAREHGIACGVVLHDLMQAAAYADTVLVLADGALVSAGPPGDVLPSAAIDRAFGLRVNVIRDPDTGYLACFPHTSASR